MSNPEVNGPIASEREQQEASTSTATPSLGAQLAAMRQERGWTIEQVASQLNLAPRQVQAIESEDYASLPGMAIVRGFVRSYAKLLKVDPTPLLATIPGETAGTDHGLAPRGTLSAPFSETRLPSMMGQHGPTRKWLVLLLFAVALLAAAWAAQQAGLLPDMPLSLSRSDAEVTSTPPVAADASSSSEPMAALNPEAGAPAGTTNETAAAAATGAPAAPAGNAGTAESATATKDAVVFKLRQDSWLEIKRAGNRTIYSGIAKAGTTETVELSAPVSVVIGNAAGVDVTVRGDPVELKPNTSSNVARLNLK